MWCFRGGFPTPALVSEIERSSHPLHFENAIAPQLRDAGVQPREIERLLVDNPRRFFGGQAPAPHL